jgi:hypothetical protein
VNLKALRRPHFSPRQLLLGGIALLTLGLVTDLRGLPSFGNRNSGTCEQMIQAKSTLSRDQLAQLLKLPEGASQAQVLALLQPPYCKLAATNAAGVAIDRQAYPLAFDLQTWLVVQYEGEKYVGYEFKLR